MESPTNKLLSQRSKPTLPYDVLKRSRGQTSKLSLKCDKKTLESRKELLLKQQEQERSKALASTTEKAGRRRAGLPKFSKFSQS